MNRVLFLLAVILLAGCRDRYDLPLRSTDVSLLVVEGVLNAGQGATTINLSRTVKVNDPAAVKPVLQARLTVEGKNGSSATLNEAGSGSYTNSQLNLVPGQDYRLRIKTSDGKEYLSDFVTARTTPAIDSVTWRVENGNLVVMANTHDAANGNKYFKWDFDETWEIRSYYFADYQYTGGSTIVPVPGGYNFRCWKYAKSTGINLGSTANLQADVISQVPVQNIPGGSEKVSFRYSMLLRQQSLSKEAYEYFQLMKKNTESIGSIFDPQPSELKGNIHCLTNPDEGVVGYVTASVVTEKRMFVTAQQAGWRYVQVCSSERVKNHPDSIRAFVPTFLPWSAEELQPGVVTYYFMAPAVCVDCTKRGGNLAMPSYW